MKRWFYRGRLDREESCSIGYYHDAGKTAALSEPFI
jgi:hypothetical protein